MLSSLPAPEDNTREQPGDVGGYEVAPSYAFLLLEFCFPLEKLLDAIWLQFLQIKRWQDQEDPAWVAVRMLWVVGS